MTKKIAIIGAGISGLACAYELQKAGFEVTVFEKNDFVGGRMSTRVTNGFAFDLGANHLCDLYDHMKEYCQEFNIPWQEVDLKKYGLYKNGKIYPLEKSVGILSRLRLTGFIAGLKHDTDFFDAGTAVQYDDDNAYDYMKKKTGREVADYLADGMSTTYQFHRAAEISKGALMAYIQSHKFDKGRWALHHIPGGMQTLPNALAERLNVKTGISIQKVTQGEEIEVCTDDKTDTFDLVVMATTADATKSILKNQTAKQSELLEKTEYATTISLAYKVDADLLPEISIVWAPYIQSKKISGYTNEKNKGSEMIRDQKSLICAWLHEEFAKTIIDKDKDEIFSLCKKELINICPWFKSEDQLENFDVQKWDAAEPKFYHGHLRLVKKFMESGQGENNIFFCGDYLNSPWTEGALRCGQRVAGDIISRQN